MAAKMYSSLDKKMAYTIFHSGAVQFGDAHPFQNCERALRKPAAWFLEKGKSDTDSSKIYIQHLIPDEEMQSLLKKGIQLKQIRDGFFLPSGRSVKLRSFFTLKSAHDRECRRSKDNAMFGYTALRRGSEWQFTVGIPQDDSIEDFILKVLLGEHRLGRSRSAQFGKVNIEFLEKKDSQLKIGKKGEVVIYASSRWMLLDSYGVPTALPTPENLDLPPGSTVDFMKSQIRTYTYAPWNGKRTMRDSDRVCIEKGSVVVVNLSSDHDFSYGIGEFKGEGNGQVQINPSFLKKSSSTDKQYLRSSLKPCVKIKSKCISVVSEIELDKKLMSFLKQRNIQSENSERILSKVNQFIETKGQLFDRISSSQWGQIRSLAMKADSLDELINDLFAEKTGFLMHGIRESSWKGKPREALRDFFQTENGFTMPMAITLASEMQKKVASGKEINHGN